MVDEVGGLLCTHLKHPPPAGYVCLPLMAKGDVLGLLHIRNRAEEIRGDAARTERPWEDVSATLSEMLSLSLSNIRLRENLSNQSIRDPLTGLFNRRYVEENLQREISRAARKKEPVGVVMIDIDHFKTFNDLHGHAAGDRVLVELAGFLQSQMRGADIVCRYGGEEFTLILPECTLDNTIRRANQLVADARQTTVQDGGRTLGHITLSMGVAAYPEHGANPAAPLAAADAVLYKAKQAGRDRVVSA
jgi:diguanylate cyclase (GGDEF)-like protein